MFIPLTLKQVMKAQIILEPQNRNIKGEKTPNVIASFFMIQSEEVISALAIEGNTFVLSF